jgi:hypothetical protein
MVSSTHPSLDRRDLSALLSPFRDSERLPRGLEVKVAGDFLHDGRRHELPRLRFTGPVAEHEAVRLGFFAGLHGDEPAGCQALVAFVGAIAAEPERAKGYDLWLYPVCNPTGYEDRTRFSRAGKDLNREFWRDSAEPEVRLLEAELTAHRFHGILTLHEDDTCEGIYGYAHGAVLNEALLEPALRAAEKMLPRDRRREIDGFAAVEGVLRDCFPGVLAAPPVQRPQPFDLIFETPGKAPLPAQVEAAGAALESILREYRAFIAYGANL